MRPDSLLYKFFEVLVRQLADIAGIILLLLIILPLAMINVYGYVKSRGEI